MAKQIVFSTPVNRIKLLRQFYASQETDLDPVLESMQSLAQPVAEKQTDSEAGKLTCPITLKHSLAVRYYILNQDMYNYACSVGFNIYHIIYLSKILV